MTVSGPKRFDTPVTVMPALLAVSATLAPRWLGRSRR